MLSGGWLDFVLILLALWFALLCRTGWRLLKVPRPDHKQTIRSRLSIGGIGFSTVAVGSLLVLHLSWISPGVSQHLGVAAIRILSLLLFWSTLVGFLLSASGSGRIRFLGMGTSLITGLWWLSLYTAAAISMGAPIARHPTNFLIPDGYVGWVEVKYGEKNAPVLPTENGTYICRIPESGLLKTSSPLEAGWAKDEYFYYSEDGSIHALKDTGWGRGGMIWAGATELQQTPDGSQSKEAMIYFFYVGTEGQYHRAVPFKEGRPFNEPKSNKIAP